jgi:SAM-dependent methyltransferase
MSGAGASRVRDYADQARTYDYTRGASPTVMRSLGKYLGDAGERSLLDIAAGTGNYSQALAARGFRVFALDREFEMLAYAARKLGPGRCIVGDAMALPISDGAVDCATTVSALHHFEDPLAGLKEARRVLREGPLAVAAFTRENLVPLFVYEYFGASWPARRMEEEDILAMMEEAGFRRVERQRLVYTDTVDGTIPSLHTDPMHLAGPAYLRNTNLWRRADEDARRKGLEALAHDLRSGRLAERVKESYQLALEYGHVTVFAGWP